MAEPCPYRRFCLPPMGQVPSAYARGDRDLRLRVLERDARIFQGRGLGEARRRSAQDRGRRRQDREIPRRGGRSGDRDPPSCREDRSGDGGRWEQGPRCAEKDIARECLKQRGETLPRLRACRARQPRGYSPAWTGPSRRTLPHGSRSKARSPRVRSYTFCAF